MDQAKELGDGFDLPSNLLPSRPFAMGSCVFSYFEFERSNEIHSGAATLHWLTVAILYCNQQWILTLPASSHILYSHKFIMHVTLTHTPSCLLATCSTYCLMSAVWVDLIQSLFLCFIVRHVKYLPQTMLALVLMDTFDLTSIVLLFTVSLTKTNPVCPTSLTEWVII